MNDQPRINNPYLRHVANQLKLISGYIRALSQFDDVLEPGYEHYVDQQQKFYAHYYLKRYDQLISDLEAIRDYIDEHYLGE